MNVGHSSLARDPGLNSGTPEHKINPLCFRRPLPTVGVNKNMKQELRSASIEGGINFFSKSIDRGMDFIFEFIHSSFKCVHASGKWIHSINRHRSSRAIACLRKLGVTNRSRGVGEILGW